MVNRVCSCNCADVEEFCTGMRKTTVRVSLLLSSMAYGWLSYIIVDRMLLRCTQKWTQYDCEVFAFVYSSFSLLYFIVFEEIMKPFEYVWFIMVRLYRCMRFCMRYIRKHVRLPTRSDFRLIFSRRAIDRNQPQPEISNSDNESSDDKPPPLPPRNRVVLEPRTTMFQKLTPKVTVRVKSRSAIEDKNPDLSPSHLPIPHCSKQSAESSRRWGKKLTKRSHFKNMMSKVTNLQAISEEDLDQQGASEIKVPLSILTQKSSHGETEKETSDEQMAFGMQNQSSERLPELAFDTDDIERQTSLHQPLASTCLQVSQSQTQAQSSAVSHSGSQEHSKMPHIQKHVGKGDPTVARYVKLPQLEEHLAFSEIITEKKQNSPEQSAVRDVPILLQGQVSSMPGIQKMPSYQGQTFSADVGDLQQYGRTSDVQKRRFSRKHSPIPNYKKYSDSERQTQGETLNVQPIQSRIQFYSAENQQAASGIGDVHEFSKERGLHEKSLQEASAPRTSRTSNVLEKLRNLHKASAAGFPVATSEIRQDHTLRLMEDYAGENFRGKAEKVTYQKRRGSLSLVSERPVRESNTKTKKTEGFAAENTSRFSESSSIGLKTSSIQRQQISSSGDTPHSVLPWSGGTPTQAHGETTPLKTEGDDQIGQQSYRGLLNLHEMYKLAAQRKTFLTLALTTGGLVLRNDGAEEDETVADSSEQSYMYDQPAEVLDLSHIEAPLSPKAIDPSKDDNQNLGIPILESSSRTKEMEEFIESTPRLSACARRELQKLSVLREQIEASQGGYTPHALPSTSTQTQVANYSTQKE